MSRTVLVGFLLFLAPQLAAPRLAAPRPAQQSPLRVLHVTPASAITPTEPVTITFDRPIVGSLGRVIDPERVASLQPALPVRFEWRDPSTLRLVPMQPWRTGQVVMLVIDTTFVALDGSRLTTPARIPIRVKGPAMRATMPPLAVARRTALPPDGRLRVLYSSPADTLMLARVFRYEFAASPACERRVVSLRVAVQRPLSANDDWQFTYAVGRDSAARAVAQVVELVPTSRVPDGCQGMVVVPSLDSLDATEIRYPITAAPRFAYSWLMCASANDCAASGAVTLTFTSPVSLEAARAAIRIDGEPAEFMQEPGPVVSSVILRMNLRPRDAYRITLDRALADVAGRPLTGPREITLVVGDRAPRVSHAAGFITLPRGAAPFIRVSHVNVDSALLELVPMPATALAGLYAMLGDTQRLWDRPGVTRRVIALGGVRNELRTTDVPLPELTAPATQVLALRLRLRQGTPGIFPSYIRTERERTPIAMRDTMTTAPAVLQVTNLAVHARVDERRGAVLVTDLRRGRPIRDALVTLREPGGIMVARARTDSSGVAVIGSGGMTGTAFGSSGTRPLRLIDVESPGDRALLPVAFDGRMSLDAAAGREVPLRSWLGPDLGRRALVFTDRDLYRPGERVFLGAVARDGPLEQLRVPGSDSRFRWVARAWANEGQRVIHERAARFTRFGTSADSFDLARTSPLGYHVAELQREIDGQWLTVSQVTFQVLEYRAPEFAVTLTGDSVPHFVGDTLTWRVSGRYLYDAPMRGSTVHWGATVSAASPWDLEIPSLPSGFGFGDPAAGWEGRTASPPRTLGGTETLDANGGAEIRMADRSPLDGTLRVSFSVAVEDVNRQVVTASHDVLLFGSAHYLALRSTGWWWRVGVPVRVEVLAVRPDGSRAAGEAITARLVHSRWVDSSGIGARGRWISDTVATWPVVSADTAITLAFTPRGGGYYTLQLLSRDSAGRAVESRLRRFVFGGSSWRPAEGPPTRLAIEADSAYHPMGATATVRFESPFAAADAWVTVEREGLLRQFRRPARRGPNEIGITISADMAPAALVGIVLLNRAPTGADDDSLHRRIRVGMVRVRVDSLVKRLAVAVAPEQREVAPGAEVRMRLHVTDYRGRGTPATLTVWAVDEGVLSMGEYQRPDPVDVLQTQHTRWLALASTMPSAIPVMQRRSPPVDQQRRDRAALTFSVNSLALSEVVVTGVGAADAMRTLSARGEARQGPGVRQDFRTTAFFSAVALTDDAGLATVTVRLPDNITTYRLFAVAVGAGDLTGSAESTFVATRPLVVRAALPRFVRAGDTFLAGAAIGARDGRPREVQVETEGTGISLTSAPTTTLRLGATAAEAKFSWTAREGDSARVTIAATDGTNRDAVRAAVPVKPDRFPLARSVAGVVRSSMTVRITIPRDVDLARSRLTIRAGTTPLTVIDEAREYLFLYPYACTEQLLASARVLVASLTLQRAGVPVKIDRGNALGALQSIIDQLAERQRWDGAFGYWSSDSWSTPWLSTAVGLLLVDASSAGARVDDRLTTRLRQYLERSLDSVPFLPDTTSGTRLERRQTAARHLGERLAAASYLRRVGQPRDAEVRALLERETLLAWEDRVLLAHVLHDAGDVTEAARLLQQVWRAVGAAGLRVDLPDSIAGRGLFHSRVRPAARLVEATVAINPSHPRLGALMERIVSRSASNRWFMWNTQDYASAASAVAAFTRVVPRGESVLTASLGSLGNGTASRVTLRTIDGAAVDSTIALTAIAQPSGDSLVVMVRLVARNGPIFFGLTSHEVSASPDTRPVANGVTVERWYERFDNGEPATEVREGELVRVRLRVTVPNQREFLAVEDHLPAGLEAVDLSLRTSGTLGPFSTEASEEARARRDREAAAGGAVGSWDSGWWSPWEHSEKRDDRVTWFARALPSGAYTATYVARATTAGRFIRPPSRAEEMYNAATGGRSEGGIFVITERRQ